MAERFRVLVLDATERQSLAACRALGRAGHEVGAGGHRPSAIAGFSRYTARYHELPSPRGPAETFLAALLNTVEAHAYQVVLATLDPTLARLAGTRLPVPTFPLLGEPFERLTDKAGLAQLCRELDIPYPRTHAPADQEEDREAAAAVGMPIVVKAARSAVARPDRVAAHSGATITRDADRALEAASSLRAKGLAPIFQEHVAGSEKLNAMLIRRDGRVEFRYAHRALREIPPAGGMGVRLETVDSSHGVGGEAIELLEKVCAAAGLEGLGMAELYRSRRDGRLYLIEVNPRLWGSTWFAERLGLQVSERCVRLALGLPPLPEVPYPAGRRFHSWPGELRSALLEERRGHALLDVLRGIRPWDVWEYQDLRDPLPILRYALQRLRRGGAR